MLISEFFKTTYRSRRLLGKSANTTRLYLLSIKSFGLTLERPATLDDLTDDNLAIHMQRLLDNGRAPGTANKDRAQLLAIWRLATQLKLKDTWPNVQILTEPERTPTAWLSDEIHLLLNVIDKQTGDFCGVPRRDWWRAMILTCLDSGERIGAVATAEWSWLNGEWITIPAEARKGKRRDRSFKLSPDTLAAIQKIQTRRKEIFPWPYCRVYLWTLYKKLLIEAKLPAGRRDAFHKLRRTTASTVHAAGLDAQDALDHQYRRTTQRYLDPRFTRTDQPCDVLASFLANPTTTPEKTNAPQQQQKSAG